MKRILAVLGVLLLAAIIFCVTPEIASAQGKWGSDSKGSSVGGVSDAEKSDLLNPKSQGSRSGTSYYQRAQDERARRQGSDQDKKDQ